MTSLRKTSSNFNIQVNSSAVDTASNFTSSSDELLHEVEQSLRLVELEAGLLSQTTRILKYSFHIPQSVARLAARLLGTAVPVSCLRQASFVTGLDERGRHGAAVKELLAMLVLVQDELGSLQEARLSLVVGQALRQSEEAALQQQQEDQVIFSVGRPTIKKRACWFFLRKQGKERRAEKLIFSHTQGTEPSMARQASCPSLPEHLDEVAKTDPMSVRYATKLQTLLTCPYSGRLLTDPVFIPELQQQLEKQWQKKISGEDFLSRPWATVDRTWAKENGYKERRRRIETTSEECERTGADIPPDSKRDGPYLSPYKFFYRDVMTGYLVSVWQQFAGQGSFAVDEQLLAALTDVLTQKTLEHPMITPDEQTYSRWALKSCLSRFTRTGDKQNNFDRSPLNAREIITFGVCQPHILAEKILYLLGRDEPESIEARRHVGLPLDVVGGDETFTLHSKTPVSLNEAKLRTRFEQEMSLLCWTDIKTSKRPNEARKQALEALLKETTQAHELATKSSQRRPLRSKKTDISISEAKRVFMLRIDILRQLGRNDQALHLLSKQVWAKTDPHCSAVELLLSVRVGHIIFSLPDFTDPFIESLEQNGLNLAPDTFQIIALAKAEEACFFRRWDEASSQLCLARDISMNYEWCQQAEDFNQIAPKNYHLRLPDGESTIWPFAHRGGRLGT